MKMERVHLMIKVHFSKKLSYMGLNITPTGIVIGEGLLMREQESMFLSKLDDGR